MLTLNNSPHETHDVLDAPGMGEIPLNNEFRCIKIPLQVISDYLERKARYADSSPFRIDLEGRRSRQEGYAQLQKKFESAVKRLAKVQEITAVVRSGARDECLEDLLRYPICLPHLSTILIIFSDLEIQLRHWKNWGAITDDILAACVSIDIDAMNIAVARYLVRS